MIMFWNGICGLSLAIIAITIDHFKKSQEDGAGADGLALFGYSGKVYGLMIGAALFNLLAVNSVTIAY